LINSSSNNIYPMDCEPSLINITSNQPPSLNINQQRYLQHMHSARSGRYNVMAPPLALAGGYISQQKYAPSSLPLDLITVAAAAANNGNSGSNSISMVLPSSTTSTQDHLTSSASLIINHPAATVAGGYAPFTHESTSIHHQNLPKVVGTASSRNNSNTNNNNASNDDSMVGVCVQQSPVVIH
jgi:hypothetical protein